MGWLFRGKRQKLTRRVVPPCVISEGLPGRLFQTAPVPELPAGAAILTSRPWAPVLQSGSCGHVGAGAAAAEGPDWPCPAAAGAACPDPFQAAAGAARDRGEREGKGAGEKKPTPHLVVERTEI